jgi:hypothetical protein
VGGGGLGGGGLGGGLGGAGLGGGLGGAGLGGGVGGGGLGGAGLGGAGLGGGLGGGGLGTAGQLAAQPVHESVLKPLITFEAPVAEPGGCASSNRKHSPVVVRQVKYPALAPPAASQALAQQANAEAVVLMRTADATLK